MQLGDVGEGTGYKSRSQLGHAVIEAASAEEALALLTSHEVDILVTDVGLSGISGVELSRRARAQLPNLPVLFATGRTTVEGLDASPHNGLLVKLFSAEELHAAIVGLTGAQAD